MSLLRQRMTDTQQELPLDKQSWRKRTGNTVENRQKKHLVGADMDTSSIIAAWRRQPVWMVLAVSSGACAAFNGVFAKLTTTSLTSHLATSLSTLLNLSADNQFINIALRGTFFLLNLAFNALMWALFTAALTRAESTTRVSIINTSANFMVTAMLGWMIFGEKLGGMWWVGAAMLAVGNVVIGRREEGQKPGGTSGLDESREEAERLMGSSSERDGLEDLVELDESGTSEGRMSDEQQRLRKGQAVDDPI